MAECMLNILGVCVCDACEARKRLLYPPVNPVQNELLRLAHEGRARMARQALAANVLRAVAIWGAMAAASELRGWFNDVRPGARQGSVPVWIPSNGPQPPWFGQAPSPLVAGPRVLP